MEICKGVYGLPQAGIIDHTQLKEHLFPVGYRPCRYTLGLWEHKIRNTKFCLVVDDFWIKYTSDDNLQYFLSALRTEYKILVGMEGALFCVITLQWDYVKQMVQLNMPGYVRLALERFQHRRPNSKIGAPHKWKDPTYGRKRQMADDPDNSPPLSPEKKQFSNKSLSSSYIIPEQLISQS